MTYKQAFERAMTVKSRFGRMPTWEEFERFLGDDLGAVVKGLKVKSSREIPIAVLHEMRRREGKPERVLDNFPHAGKSPMANPEKRYLGAAVDSRGTQDRLWRAVKGDAGHREPH